jgi:hypothetical protein
MATTTTNFGWDIPQSTDLVKDGATAIAALGQDIDTALVDLKGGTTGQVLAKASGTNLDFSWVAQDDSNAIQNAIVDAKGDLISATANDTPARLAVGANGTVLTADSTTATGLAWGTPPGGGMTLLSTTTLSGTSTSISVTPTGYNNLAIYVSQVNCASDYTLTMRINGDTTATNYRNSWQADIGYALDQGRSSGVVGSLVYTIPGVNGTESGDTNNAAYIELNDPNSSVSKNIFTISSFLNDSAFRTSMTTQCSYVTTSAISSVQFLASQSLTAGTVLIYGVK